MGRKIIGMIIILLIASLLLPSILATPTFGNKKEIFKDCYIEATGDIEPSGGSLIKYVMWKNFWFRPFGDDRSFVFLWLIEWMEPDVTVTIYQEKNGEILWQDTDLIGIWGMRLIWYNGIYTNDGTTEDQLVVNLQGNAKVVIVYTED